MAAIGDWEATTGVDQLLPNMQDSYAKYFSITRYKQLRASLSQAWERTLGSGVLSGGVLVAGTGLEVKLQAPTVVISGGVPYEVTADQSFTGLIDGTGILNTVWACLRRTAANPDDRAAPDTYALFMAATSTDTAPPGGDRWWRLGYVAVSAGVLGTITNEAPGKYAPVRAMMAPIFTLAPEASDMIQATLDMSGPTGALLAVRSAVLVWLADAANGPETSTVPSGGWTANIGYKLTDLVAGKSAYFMTDAAGRLRINVTHAGAKTYYLHVLVNGVVYNRPLAFT